jgi:hypothetical protein
MNTTATSRRTNGSNTVGCFIVQGGKRASGQFFQLGLISFLGKKSHWKIAMKAVAG